MSEETMICSAAVPQQGENVADEDKSLQELLESGGALGALLAREHLTEIDFILGQRYFPCPGSRRGCDMEYRRAVA